MRKHISIVLIITMIMSTFVFTSVSAASTFVPDTVVEAEKGEVANLMTESDDATASGKKYLSVMTGGRLDDPETLSEPDISLTFKLENAGKYALWARCIVVNESCDTVWFRWDKNDYTQKGLSTCSEWQWQKLGEFDLDSGRSKLSFTHREMKGQFDAFYLASDVDGILFDAGMEKNNALVVLGTPTPTPSPKHYQDIVFEDVESIDENYVPTKKVTIKDEKGFDDAIANIQPGTAIYFDDGVYADFKKTFTLHGTKEAPIIIAAKNPGKAEFTGYTQFVISGEYIMFRDFYFNEVLYNTVERPEFEKQNVFTLKGATNCRMYNNYFYKCGLIGDGTAADRSAYKKIISIGNKAQRNRVDHNTFDDPYCMQIGIYVDTTANSENFYNKIDHNHFVNVEDPTLRRPGVDVNGCESVQIGQSTASERQSPNTFVEYNLFENVVGDKSEIISNKSSNNVFRHNTFIDCDSGVTIRSAAGSIVDSNYFINTTKGVRVFGDNHLVVNNYFDNVARRSIEIGMGNVSGLYAQARNNTIENNTVINPGILGIALDAAAEWGSVTEGQIAPDSNVIRNNVVMTEHGNAFTYLCAENMTLQNNYMEQLPDAKESYVADGITPSDLKLTIKNGLYVPTDGSPFLKTSSLNEYVTEDIDGVKRGEKADAGAFELAEKNGCTILSSKDDVGTTWKKGVSTKSSENKLLTSVALRVGKSMALSCGNALPIDASNSEVTPVVINDRTLVPVRFIAEAFGADVGWDDATATVSIKKDKTQIYLIIGSNEINVNGVANKMDTEAVVMNDRTLVPLRAISESLGKTVYWDGETELIAISDNEIDKENSFDSRFIDAALYIAK